MMIMMTVMMMRIVMGCTQNPISTLSHIWVFVRLYGIDGIYDDDDDDNGDDETLDKGEVCECVP